jgi:hypothetical protein
MKGAIMIIPTRFLLAPVVAGACVAGFTTSSHAEANMVVLNSSAHDITVACNATGKIAPGNGGWSCIDAKIVAGKDTYSVKDTHGHNGCKGGAWSIQYVHDNNKKVLTNACTNLSFGQIACHYVQVLDKGLRVSVQKDDNACAGQYASQFGPKIFHGLLQIVESVPIIPK